MEIPPIRTDLVREIKVQQQPAWVTNPPQAIPPVVPITSQVGIPIIDMPGCVEAHEQGDKSNSITTDDAQGAKIFCDAGMPSFNPIQYEPEQMIMTYPPAVGGTDTEKPKPPTPQTDTPPPAPPSTAAVECPTKVQIVQEPVGTFVEGFRKKVTGYELIDKTCVQITESVGIPTQILAGLPSGGQVMQVGGIAVIATTSALLAKPLADILLKAVKPTVKKVTKKIAAIRKKPIPVKSSGVRRAEQRQMNHAVRALRSVFPRRKKKR